MARALEEQMAMADIAELGFEERLGLLVEREVTERESRRFENRLRRAKLREQATVEDLDWRLPRQLDRAQVMSLASCRWIADHLNVLIVGKTGVGKTYLACAFAHKACREGFSALYVRVPTLLRELEIARGDGSYDRLLRRLARADLLALDDWGLVAPNEHGRRDLLEIFEERYGRRSTLVASQVPVKQWHDLIGDPTLADAILDRLVHGAYRLELEGESVRGERARRRAGASGERSTKK
jgi:DNA replication protein DnaC